MKCPYCNQPMKIGQIHAPASHGVYWLPEGAKMSGSLLSQKGIEGSGGIVMDEVYKVGFLSKSKPETAYCEECGVLITVISTPPPALIR